MLQSFPLNNFLVWMKSSLNINCVLIKAIYIFFYSFYWLNILYSVPCFICCLCTYSRVYVDWMNSVLLRLLVLWMSDFNCKILGSRSFLEAQRMLVKPWSTLVLLLVCHTVTRSLMYDQREGSSRGLEVGGTTKDLGFEVSVITSEIHIFPTSTEVEVSVSVISIMIFSVVICILGSLSVEV